MLVGCPLNGGAAASTSEKDCRKAGVNTTNICYNLEPLSCQAKGLGPLFFGTKQVQFQQSRILIVVLDLGLGTRGLAPHMTVSFSQGEGVEKWHQGQKWAMATVAAAIISMKIRCGR